MRVMQKYSVNQQLIEIVLAWVKAGEIAIPEIQRPFVWDSSKVFDMKKNLQMNYIPVNKMCLQDFGKEKEIDGEKFWGGMKGCKHGKIFIRIFAKIIGITWLR